MKVYICEGCRAESPAIYLVKDDGSVDERPEAEGWKQSIDKVGRAVIVTHCCARKACLARAKEVRAFRMHVVHESSRHGIIELGTKDLFAPVSEAYADVAVDVAKHGDDVTGDDA